ncbi:Cgl0159 family (beta/alpha)8-fold protein [Trueperella pecoris]|uniref:Deoxyribose-phosphate aldolase n=1 Tax=Trueperella pecoris TaxID=2733571 RepID=A0A7M1QUG3_9ACTO|nr:deoxyribose-phosphate aldolase [Trueperella pecoris]QOQ39592.1 deoxyribose-phosphate aldolase [Trueperella pecoris]QOR45782.1 deoxyribose-phosphate aldolase [Trueperella pecoris]
MVTISDIPSIRLHSPQRVKNALANRRPGAIPTDGRKLLIIACDHPARGALGAGEDPSAMANRAELLERCMIALSRPGVNGFLGTADLIEDLTLLGALDNKLVFGSMNRTGLQGSAFEIDDRFGCYTPEAIAAYNLDGGKTLTRICLEDSHTPHTLEATAHAVDQLAKLNKVAMIEPFISTWKNGRIVNDLSADAVIMSIAIASALGSTSAHTWLKLPYTEDMERVLESTTLPSLILGGEVPADPNKALSSWAQAMTYPNVFGLVIGRSLLFPHGGDVQQAVDNAVELL